MEKKYKICFLGYHELSTLARNIIDHLEYDDVDVLLLDCNVETLPEAVDTALKKGYDFFIAGFANAAKFRNSYKYHLVEIRLRMVDYLVAIQKAMKIGQHPVFAVYKYSREVDFDLLEQLSGIMLEKIYYEDSSELFYQIEHMQGDVVIGGAHSCEIASDLGRRYVLLYPGEDTIRATILRARSAYRNLNEEITKVRTMQEIIRKAPFGLIVTDEKGIVTQFNKTAETQSEITNRMVMGNNIRDVLPSLSVDDLLSGKETKIDKRHLINGVKIRCLQTPIYYQNNLLGTLTTMYPDNTRQRKLEMEDAERYVARKRFKDGIGESDAFCECRDKALSYAKQYYPIVIDGEAGVGKNFFSQCIHNASANAAKPYVIVDGATIPENDIQNILFGREENGSVIRGLFEIGREGTIVLKNLHMTSVRFQACIIQVLVEKRFFHVYGTQAIPFQGQIITIIEDRNQHEGISSQLWDMLSIMKLSIPSIRERKEDIPAIFLKLLLNEQVKMKKIPEDIAQLLMFRDWTGNLTELAAIAKRYAFLINQTSNDKALVRYMTMVEAIGKDKLMTEIVEKYPALKNPSSGNKAEIHEGIDWMKSLLKCNNDQIAKELGISRTTLWRLLN